MAPKERRRMIFYPSMAEIKHTNKYNTTQQQTRKRLYFDQSLSDYSRTGYTDTLLSFILTR